MTPLQAILLLGGALFSLGLYGVLARQNAVLTLMSIELMLNAVNLNLIGFARYGAGGGAVGQIIVVFIITVAAAEAGLFLAILLRLYRSRATVNLDRVDSLRR